MSAIQNSNFPTTLFLSHGGGPLPLLGDEGHSEMVAGLRKISAMIRKPEAIVVISAHWEEEQPTLTSGANPPLIYDYYGFPLDSYKIQYPAKGHPLLANSIASLLRGQGVEPALDEQRGFDHGLFVPLKIMFPEADIPCVQLSLVKGLDAKQHIEIGQALVGLDNENLLIIGSGFSFHNMKAFFSPTTAETTALNESFEGWLIDTCSNPEMSESDRRHRLENWEDAPAARYCHPREEHLLPLHVCYGLANRPCKDVFEMNILRKKASAYLW